MGINLKQNANGKDVEKVRNPENHENNATSGIYGYGKPLERAFFSKSEQLIIASLLRSALPKNM